jgi:nucleoside 2-deoxyribosyltransferase
MKHPAPAVRIYCAGPLFNRGEQGEMAEIAATLEAAGFGVFLPQRDGLVFAEILREMLRGGYTREEAASMIQRAVFWLDAYQVVQRCDGLLASLNGRTPDEGAVAEAAMAWATGKPVVLYKSDTRSVLEGSDNPLVAGLGGFVRVATIPEIAYAFRQIFRARRTATPLPFPPDVKSAVAAGRRLAQVLATDPSPAGIVPAIVGLVRSGAHGPSR